MRLEYAVVLGPLVALIVAWVVTRNCCRPGAWLHFLDHPNERSLHVKPVPRTGGVGVMAGIAVGGVWLTLFDGLAWAHGMALAGALLLAGLGLIDDRCSISARIRLLIQILLAGGFLVLTGMDSGGLTAGVLLLGLVWMANLYNFMDGSDGLAGGMAVSGFSAFSVTAVLAGESGLALTCGIVAAAAAGFLWFNFYPARIFMGDAGSVPLGFLAGSLGLAGYEAGVWSLWFPALVFSPFIVDATVTLLRRVVRGERAWQAHRTHYYQRMVRMGLGHRGTALRAYILMAAAGLSAIVTWPLGFSLQCSIMVVWFFIYLILGLMIDRAWRRHELTGAKSP
ncbi:MAG: glycosyltransferase family 4 protein [Zoogloea oleivorans]|uniref:MraY family glycosyltransferase n=1 Tax=Zoogloea oleivorans TaxID=1552750 RepID=UPI002A3604DA|nr:glycosyltransferase family 4 protein [Zoogloea oleivorans]MDY0036808.1 glycosyltransferase family 4 protein [Zoogloea oleivorans]